MAPDPRTSLRARRRNLARLRNSTIDEGDEGEATMTAAAVDAAAMPADPPLNGDGDDDDDDDDEALLRGLARAAAGRRRRRRTRIRTLHPRNPTDPWGRHRRHAYRGDLRIRLITKMLSYGFFFLLFKFYRAKYPRKQIDGGGEEPKWRSSSEERTSGGYDEQKLLSPSWRQWWRLMGLGVTPDAAPPAEGVRRFKAGPNSADVHVVSNFLPSETAERWRDALANEWSRHEAASAGGGAPPSSARDRDGAAYRGGAWRFATAPPPLSAEGEDDVAFRNGTAQAARVASASSLARWELDPAHPLWGEAERTFLGEDARNRIGRIVGRPRRPGGSGGEVRLDAVVAHYGPGDFFLGRSGEGLSGAIGVGDTEEAAVASWHFILSLASPPESQGGGGAQGGPLVRFQCQFERGTTQPALCESVRLEFNAAILMTQGTTPVHEVVPIAWGDWAGGSRHFSVMGSYQFGSGISDDEL